MRYSIGESGVIEMTLQEIHDMAADALAGEELQFRTGERSTWQEFKNTWTLFHPAYAWRIKPTIEVNGAMMTKRQAQDAWIASEATSYEFYNGTAWGYGTAPTWTNSRYRWQEPKWIYVNGEKIVRLGGHVSYHDMSVANDLDGEKLKAAINKLVEIK
jgi:hypothetical protein